MKKILLTAIITILMNASVFSAEKAAVEDTSTPSASGPLDTSSISIPADAMRKPTQIPPTGTVPTSPSLDVQTNSSHPSLPSEQSAPPAMSPVQSSAPAIPPTTTSTLPTSAPPSSPPPPPINSMAQPATPMQSSPAKPLPDINAQ